MNDRDRATLDKCDQHLAWLRSIRRPAPRARNVWDLMVEQDLRDEIAACERDEWRMAVTTI